MSDLLMCWNKTEDGWCGHSASGHHLDGPCSYCDCDRYVPLTAEMRAQQQAEYDERERIRMAYRPRPA